jgi:predicted aminopeptidase
MTTTFLPRFRHWLAPLSAFLLAGCQSMAYYAQAAQGQVQLLAKRQPIDRMLSRQDLDPLLRQRLETVQRIRAFAHEALGLPARRQYASYVELGRDYPVWSVMATPSLSLAPRTWCYWLVGCLSYRGFFREEMATRYAGELEAEGYDVYLGGVSAYSTLGWFRDPVLSSFIRLPEAELAELIFHELTHQVLFVPGDTVFNESLAVTVAEEGLRRYSERHGLDLAPLALSRQRQREFVALVLGHRRRLADVFASAPDAAAKQQGKEAAYAALRQDYVALREGWGGYAGYDAWLATVNNAKLNSVATYYDLVPSLQALLRANGNDMARFLASCRELARLDLAARHQRLRTVLAQAASGAPAS